MSCIHDTMYKLLCRQMFSFHLEYICTSGWDPGSDSNYLIISKYLIMTPAFHIPNMWEGFEGPHSGQHLSLSCFSFIVIPVDHKMVSHCSIFLLNFNFIWRGSGGWTQVTLLRAYSWALCSGSFLAGFEWTSGVLGIEPGSATYKANVIPAGLLLWPHERVFW